MRIQRYILKSKNKITAVSFLLILSGLILKYLSSYQLSSEILLIIASIIGIAPIAIQAYQAIRVKVVSIDLLVTIAVIGAFFINNFEESSIVTFLFLFGSFLEERTLRKTRKAVKDLIEMAPEIANKKTTDGSFVEVSVDDVTIGDILLVKTGDKIPVDGIVLNGGGYANQAAITGESISVKLARNDEVFAGTILEDGTIEIIASKVGEDTTFGKIIELVEQSQDSKSKTERIINKFSKYYTPIVLLIGLLTLIFTKNIALSVTVLVLGCPGALVIGVPVSNVAGIGSGARSGVLIKGSETINNFSNLDVLIFDKTGTLTNGTPEVVKEYIYGNKKDIEKAIDYLYSVELEQTHPLAKAIIKHIRNGKKLLVEDTEVIKGSGVKAIINNDDVLVGNKRLMESENIILISEMIDTIDELEKSGSSVVITAINKEVHIIMGIKDDVRDGLKNDIKNIYQKGIKELVILSGDNQQTVDLVATELGIKKAYGNMLPEDKANYIKKLQNKGLKIGFVGDGINDSPSLAIADIGIAMGSGTDIAIETSDVVLLNGNIEKLSYGLSLSRRIVNNIIQNITIAIGVVIVLITSLLYGNWLNMSIGMLIHELSILVVILNGMRLLRFRYKTKEV